MLEKETIVEKKKLGFGALTLITLLTTIAVIAGIVFIMRSAGRASLQEPVAGTQITDIGEPAAEDDPELALKENQILYQGQLYEQNTDLITILVMGIDKETVTSIGGQSWTEDEAKEYAGGQADALFLALLNPHTKTVNIVAINRNSMVDVDVFDEDGRYVGIFKKQVALQHGYGDGGEESCKRQVKTVSRMFHNIPIHAYAAISMDAIPEINDAVGGITVEVLDDIIYPEFDMDLHQGQVVTLMGEKAYWYVRLRNENVFNSNLLRLNRQKQYLSAFANTAREQATADVRVAINLYQTVQKYMVTDIDINRFTYLVTEALNYRFDVSNIYSLEGETIPGNVFEEFYVDDQALQGLIVELFYEPVL